jgi:hypothetical protein
VSLTAISLTLLGEVAKLKSKSGGAMPAFLRFVFAFVLSSALTAVAFGNMGLSAVRHPGEDHTLAAERSINSTSMYNVPQRMSKPLRELDLAQIPDVGSYSDMENQFKHVRDLRLVEDTRKNSMRRLTWLYPDDGCFARAEMAAHILEDNHFTNPKKIFVFGNLRAATKNAPGGFVDWWYHVAVIYRIDKTAYVFDPAINPARPVTLDEWNTAIGGGNGNSRLQYAICDHRTFDPHQDCLQPHALGVEEALSEQRMFLYPEWERLLQLHRNPEKELGDFPPWL